VLLLMFGRAAGAGGCALHAGSDIVVADAVTPALLRVRLQFHSSNAKQRQMEIVVVG
jgi:hypothetical protein